MSNTERVAGEGRIGITIAPDTSGAAIVEIRAEPDVAVHGEMFADAAATCADIVLKGTEGPAVSNDVVTAARDAARIATGGKGWFARGHKLVGRADCRFGQFIRHDSQTGVLILADVSLDATTLTRICMHIAAAVPLPIGVGANDIPADVIEKERKFRIEQAMKSGKPKEIAEKMVEGRMRRFFEEVALLEQPYVMDPSKKVADIIGGAKVHKFIRWAVGESH